ncbi:hypothetical protein EVAR_39041_1 [Eumeta japonica]|uniref:Uncharacterized protein n=1 Tax=Eumeta variegata TaxID=151549 RepID=A0A4C1WRX9_EUMVA|nr:hypothetical protein EVAR_39041_1 [Eumeta japonica]
MSDRQSDFSQNFPLCIAQREPWAARARLVRYAVLRTVKTDLRARGQSFPSTNRRRIKHLRCLFGCQFTGDSGVQELLRRGDRHESFHRARETRAE